MHIDSGISMLETFHPQLVRPKNGVVAGIERQGAAYLAEEITIAYVTMS